MSFGPEYAGVYDALYRAKDYAREAAFVLDRLEKQAGRRQLGLLDLGCGTGLHDIEFVQAGCDVVGVDRSADMIIRANERRSALTHGLASRLRFDVGDMCETDQARTFDAVVSLFHVLCYMTDDVMLAAALNTVRRHLQPDGLFLFDFWNAEAVLAEPPEKRERIVEVDGRLITRTTTPIWEPEKSLVHITYDLKGDGLPLQSETHTIRYFGADELAERLLNHKLQPLRFGEWLTDADPTAKAFGVYCLARAV